MKTGFKSKTFGWKELSILYAPGLTPHSASKRLVRWILIHPGLYEQLLRAGWIKGSHVLTPAQVEIITDYLGEP